MTHSHVWNDSWLIYLWLIYLCDMTNNDANKLIEWFRKKTFRWIEIKSVEYSEVEDQRKNSMEQIRLNLSHKARVYMWWTHSYVWHDSIHMWQNLLWCRQQERRRWVWLNFLAFTPRWVRGHDPFIRVMLPIHMSDAFICVTWLMHIYDMTHSYMWHDSLIDAT